MRAVAPILALMLVLIPTVAAEEASPDPSDGSYEPNAEPAPSSESEGEPESNAEPNEDDNAGCETVDFGQEFGYPWVCVGGNKIGGACYAPILCNVLPLELVGGEPTEEATEAESGEGEGMGCETVDFGHEFGYPYVCVGGKKLGGACLPLVTCPIDP